MPCGFSVLTNMLFQGMVTHGSVDEYCRWWALVRDEKLLSARLGWMLHPCLLSRTSVLMLCRFPSLPYSKTESSATTSKPRSFAAVRSLASCACMRPLFTSEADPPILAYMLHRFMRFPPSHTCAPIDRKLMRWYPIAYSTEQQWFAPASIVAARIHRPM